MILQPFSIQVQAHQASHYTFPVRASRTSDHTNLIDTSKGELRCELQFAGSMQHLNHLISYA